MKSTKYREYFGALLLFSIILSGLGNPLSGLGGEEVQFPFKNCEKYYLGGSRGFPIIEEKSLKLEPVFAIYPLSDETIALTFTVSFPETLLKVNIQGTMITIEKCEKSRRCTMENEEGVKSVDYIKPHMWNKVRLIMESKKLEIQIGDRIVLSKPMVDYDLNLDEIHWRIISNNPYNRKSKVGQPPYLYLVQFQCPEYEESSKLPKLQNESTFHDTESSNSDSTNDHKTDSFGDYEYHESTSEPFIPRDKDISDKELNPNHPLVGSDNPDKPNPELKPNHHANDHENHKPNSSPIIPRKVDTDSNHPGTEHHNPAIPNPQHATSDDHPKKPKEGQYVGLIVGLVVAAIILVALVIVIYNVIKKRRSMTLTESSPLNTDQQQQQHVKQ